MIPGAAQAHAYGFETITSYLQNFTSWLTAITSLKLTSHTSHRSYVQKNSSLREYSDPYCSCDKIHISQACRSASKTPPLLNTPRRTCLFHPGQTLALYSQECLKVFSQALLSSMTYSALCLTEGKTHSCKYFTNGTSSFINTRFLWNSIYTCMHI